MIFSEQAELPQAEIDFKPADIDVGVELALSVQEVEGLQGHEDLSDLVMKLNSFLRRLTLRVTLMTLWLLMSQVALSL